MKRVIFFVSLLFVFSCASYKGVKDGDYNQVFENTSHSLEFVDSKAELTVMTFNIRHGLGFYGNGDLEDIADLIRINDADLIFLQEVDVNVERSGYVNQIEQLAELTGLNAVFAPSIILKAGFYGNAMLSKFKFSDLQRINLPTHIGMEGRSGVFAKIEISEGVVASVVSTHLSFESVLIRDWQASSLLREMHKAGRGSDLYILGGDLNAEPETHTVETFAGFFRMKIDLFDYLSFPAFSPTECIDYIFARSNNEELSVSLKEFDVFDANPGASDHLPVISKILIEKP
ncbi:MAG: endonuclease/exonuclease/phosphatase family protein [Spirochaetales bacterium]|nr:endonuclease/exonuclease/phosphatase family protein [Spirochaetales bacterium]